MPRHEFDTSSKYLVGQHARGVLLLGGARDIRSVRALQAEVVQSRRLPDGLLEVHFEGQTKPDHVLVEIATYPEKRALEQALGDLTLARQYLKGVLPELLMLVLCPKGKFRIAGKHAVRSRLGWAELGCSWKVVELWTLPAEEVLKAADVGVVPFVPLARYDGPAEELLEECRERIEKDAQDTERTDLLAVSQVFTRLKFPQPELLDLLGGREVMIESPLLQEMKAEVLQEAVLNLLKDHHGKVPRDVRRLLAETLDEKKLQKLIVQAGRAQSMEAFKEHLLK
jgi:hypothetical protein